MRSLALLLFVSVLSAVQCRADSTANLLITPDQCSNNPAPVSATTTTPGDLSLSADMPCIITHNPPLALDPHPSATAYATSTTAGTMVNMSLNSTGIALADADAWLSAYLYMTVPQWAAYGYLTVTWNIGGYGNAQMAGAQLSIDGTTVYDGMTGGCGGCITGSVSTAWQPLVPGGILGSQVDLHSFFRRAGGVDGAQSHINVTIDGEFAATPEPSTLLLLGTGVCAIGLVQRRRRQGKASGR